MLWEDSSSGAACGRKKRCRKRSHCHFRYSSLKGSTDLFFQEDKLVSDPLVGPESPINDLMNKRSVLVSRPGLQNGPSGLWFTLESVAMA